MFRHFAPKLVNEFNPGDPHCGRKRSDSDLHTHDMACVSTHSRDKKHPPNQQNIAVMSALRRRRQEDHEFAFRWSTQQDPIPPPPKVSKNRRESKKVWWVLTDRASQKKSLRHARNSLSFFILSK